MKDAPLAVKRPFCWFFFSSFFLIFVEGLRGLGLEGFGRVGVRGLLVVWGFVVVWCFEVVWGLNDFFLLKLF
jgi:hypothetical protein